MNMDVPDNFKPHDVGPIEYRIRTVYRHLKTIPGLNPEDFYGRELRAFVLRPRCEFDTMKEAEAFGQKLAKLCGGSPGIVVRADSGDKYVTQVTLTADYGNGIFGRSDARKLEACSRTIDKNSRAIRNMLIEFGAELPAIDRPRGA